MSDSRNFLERHGLNRVLNALGTSTITGANVAPPEVRAAVEEALSINVEIDELQRAASRAIARATGAEAGCVTSSCSSGLAITVAASMTGADLAKILQLPDTEGMPNEVILQQAHDVNFGGQISQMLRLAGAKPVFIGTANHCDNFHLRGAMNSQTAAILYVASGVVNPMGDFLTVEQIVRRAAVSQVPVIVDAAAEPDVRPYLAVGADLVVTSAHKLMGAPTSGMICGRKDLVRACYLQNWGIGRAMKVGKEGIAGCIAAIERWYARDEAAETARYARLTAILAERLDAHAATKPSAVIVKIPDSIDFSARQLANRLREGDPPVWVREAIDHGESRQLILSLVALNEADAAAIGDAIAALFENPRPPAEDVPYHDLYWSEERLLRWPD